MQEVQVNRSFHCMCLIMEMEMIPMGMKRQQIVTMACVVHASTIIWLPPCTGGSHDTRHGNQTRHNMNMQQHLNVAVNPFLEPAHASTDSTSPLSPVELKAMYTHCHNTPDPMVVTVCCLIIPQLASTPYIFTKTVGCAASLQHSIEQCVQGMWRAHAKMPMHQGIQWECA